MRVAVASCRELPHPDVDQPALDRALAERGIEVNVFPWEDGPEPFADADLVVVRSTWNYFHREEAFLAWADAVGAKTRLFNPPAILRWNARKTYLRELEGRGIATVPTEFVARGESLSLADLFAARGYQEVVVKPLVSAGSFRTQRFRAEDAADGQAFLDDLAAGRDVMVQPFMTAVETYGERSLVWIDGTLTHAIRKAARYADDAVVLENEPVPFSADERAFAERVLAPFSKDLLYARVDTIRDEGSRGDAIRLMELELIEPFLFLVTHPPAVLAMADAIAKRR